MACPVSFSDAKINLSWVKFNRFLEVCRFGGLKPSPSKGSTSELFTKPFPCKGMETLQQHLLRLPHRSFTEPFPRKGMLTLKVADRTPIDVD